jgi:glycosyltransferase involved in cell wall biosynthesis
MKNVLLLVTRGLLKDGKTGINGPERRTFNSIEYMKKNNYFIAYSNKGYFFKEFKEKIGDRLIELDIQGIKDIKAIFLIYKIIKRYNIDLVHVQGPFASDLFVSLACKLAGVKSVITRPIIVSTDSNSFLRTFGMRIFDKIIFKTATKLTTISEKSKNDWIKEGAPVNKLEVVYNGTFLDKFIAKEDYTFKNTINCVMVGQFIDEKNHLWFLKNIALFLVKKYENIKFIFVGDGYTLKKCQNFVMENSMQKYIEFTGNVDNVYKVLSNADISFLPSIREGVPVGLIESSACGIPLIANDVGSVSEVCKHEFNGYLLNIWDKNLWINSFEQLLNSQELRENFGKNGRKLAEKQFDIDVMIKKYEEIYEKA